MAGIGQWAEDEGVAAQSGAEPLTELKLDVYAR